MDGERGIYEEIRARQSRILLSQSPSVQARLTGLAAGVPGPTAMKDNPFDPTSPPGGAPPSEGGTTPLLPSQVAQLIIRSCCAAFEVEQLEFYGRLKIRRISNCRHAAYKLIRDNTQWSYPAIARFTKRKDHTTVMHGIRRVEEYHLNNSDWVEKFERAKMIAFLT